MPTASNRKTLEALFESSQISKFQGFKVGRHDACVAIRAVAVVEAMAPLFYKIYSHSRFSIKFSLEFLQ